MGMLLRAVHWESTFSQWTRKNSTQFSCSNHIHRTALRDRTVYLWNRCRESGIVIFVVVFDLQCGTCYTPSFSACSTYNILHIQQQVAMLLIMPIRKTFASIPFGIFHVLQFAYNVFFFFLFSYLLRVAFDINVVPFECTSYTLSLLAVHTTYTFDNRHRFSSTSRCGSR